MAKKTKAPGAKEAQLRAMRETAAQPVLDRHALQEARAAARAKANEVYEAEMANVTKPLRDQIDKLTTRRTALDAELGTLEHDLTKLNKALADVLGIEAPTNGKASGKRTRRSEEDRQADAAKIVAYLEKNAGAKAGDIAAATGVNFKPSLSKFLADNGGHKVKTEGNKASTTYTLA
jgi:poly-D-alanine transfer protein DltD